MHTKPQKPCVSGFFLYPNESSTRKEWDFFCGIFHLDFTFLVFYILHVNFRLLIVARIKKTKCLKGDLRNE